MYKQFVAGCYFHLHEEHKDDQQLIFTCSSLPSSSSSSLSIVSLWSQQVIHQTRFVRFLKHRTIIKNSFSCFTSQKSIMATFPAAAESQGRRPQRPNPRRPSRCSCPHRRKAQASYEYGVTNRSMVLQIGGTSSHDGTEVSFWDLWTRQKPNNGSN